MFAILIEFRSELRNYRNRCWPLISALPSIEIQGELAPPAITNTLDELRHAALTHRPDYIGAVRSTAKAEANARLAKANGAADFTINPESPKYADCG